MSAYAHVYLSQHDYNRHPFVPIGMEALVHDKPHKRRTFAQHCKKGYVLGTSFEHYRCQTVWMVDSHCRRTSGAVWFKHKYLTHPSVTPADRITAAIGGLAKTLTTRIPTQLRDDTLDKLKRLQDILDPQVTDKSSKERYGVEATRPTSHEQASHPRVPTGPPRVVPHDYALPPRVPPKAPTDTSEWVLPSRTETPQHDSRQPDVVQETQRLRRSPRLAEKIEKLRLDVEILQKPDNKPRQSPRILELMDKRNAAAENAKRCTVLANPIQRGSTEVQTLQQELVLACIQTYAEVTGQQVSPRNLSQRRFPTEVLNAVLNKDTGDLMEMRQLLQNPSTARCGENPTQKSSDDWRKEFLGRKEQTQ